MAIFLCSNVLLLLNQYNNFLNNKNITYTNMDYHQLRFVTIFIIVFLFIFLFMFVPPSESAAENFNNGLSHLFILHPPIYPTSCWPICWTYLQQAYYWDSMNEYIRYFTPHVVGQAHWIFFYFILTWISNLLHINN